MSTVTRLRRPSERAAPPARLAVLGWSAEAGDALAALEATGRYRGVAIADPSSLALVEARGATTLPCEQQAQAYLQRGEYDALLVGSPELAEAAPTAVRRGADLLVLRSACDVGALSALADATEVYGAGLFVLDPALHDAGFPDLCRLVAPSAPSDRWSPREMDLAVEAPVAIDRLLALAVAQLVRLTPHAATTVRAETWGGALGTTARSAFASIEGPDFNARLHLRHAPTVYQRITGDALGGAFEWRHTEDGACLARYHQDGPRTAHRPPAIDQWRAEAHRVVTRDDRGRTEDLLLLRRELALLDALTRAIDSGEAQQTACCPPADAHGAGSARDRKPPGVRRSHLRLVVS